MGKTLGGTHFDKGKYILTLTGTISFRLTTMYTAITAPTKHVSLS